MSGLFDDVPMAGAPSGRAGLFDDVPMAVSARPTSAQSPLGGAIPTAADMVAHGATGPASIGQETSAVATNINDIARALSGGIPFSNRIVAAEHSLPIVGNGQGYSANLAQEDAARAQLAHDRPMLNATGNAVGGLASTLAFPGALPAEVGFLPAAWAGAKTGLAYGIAQGVADQPDLTNLGNDISGAETGGLKGAAIGSTGSALGYGAAKAGNALLDWMNELAATGSLPSLGEGRALGALADASTADANTRRILLTAGANTPPTDFGPQGMTLDSGPAMQQLAQKVASTPEGAPLKAAVIDRANNVDRAVSDALPGIIGPDQSALAAALEMKDTKAMESAALPPIFAKAPPVDVTPVFNRIGQMVPSLPAGTPEQLALARAQRMRLLHRRSRARLPRLPQGRLFSVRRAKWSGTIRRQPCLAHRAHQLNL